MLLIDFRVLLVIKRQAEIRSPFFSTVRNTLTDEDIQIVTRAFEKYTPNMVSQLTDGNVTWDADVVVSNTVLRTVDGDQNCAACSAVNWREDVEKNAPIGKYDGLFIYYKEIDDETGYKLPRPFGLSRGPSAKSNWAYHSDINWAPTYKWTDKGFDINDVFLHEWLHHVEWFYGNKGIRLPKEGLHGAEIHGYEWHAPEFWQSWYRDFLNGTVREGNEMVGLGEKAWRIGRMRDEALNRSIPLNSTFLAHM